jgi:hypothetical protein
MSFTSGGAMATGIMVATIGAIDCFSRKDYLD